MDIDLYTALLGGEKLVDTLEGQVKLKVKPETQNGTKAVSYTHLDVYKRQVRSWELFTGPMKSVR